MEQAVKKPVVVRRVRKADVKVDTWIKPDGLNTCLECWKNWMLGDDRDLSASRMLMRGGSDDADAQARGYENDVYAEQRKADCIVGEATNAMIDSLRQVHRWAMHKKCGIVTVWNFPGVDFMATVADAEFELEKKLRNNIATATQF